MTSVYNDLKRLIIKIRYSVYYLVLRNNYFLVAIATTLFLLSLNHYLYVIIFIIYLIYLFKLERKLFIASIIIIIIIFSHFLYLENRKRFLDDEIKGTIINVTNKDYHQEIIVKCSGNKVLIYDKGFINVKVGDVIYVSGKNVIPDRIHLENEFDYQKYLWHEHINGVIEASDITIIGHKFTLFVISEIVKEYYRKNFSGLQLAYLESLLLGDDSSLDEAFYNSLVINGTLHLFAISGLHISLFVGLLERLLKYLRVKDKVSNLIIISFLLTYLIITNFLPSIVRSALMYIFIQANKRFNLKLSSLDIISITFLLLIIINPYYMYNLGFILSFLVSFLIILSTTLLEGKTIYQVFVISCLAQIFTLPIVVNINNEINVLSPLVNVLSVGIVEGIILPASVFISFLPLLQDLYYYLIFSFHNLSLFLSNYFVIVIRFRDFTPLMIIIYYGLIILIINNFHHIRLRKVLTIVFCFYLGIIYHYQYFLPYGEVHFLDLYNGEATIITIPFSDKTVVIDTGDGRSDALTTFLKNKGIRKIDLLIITHNHRDHNGELNTLLRHFHINKIVVSAYYNNELTGLKNVIRVQEGSIITCGKMKFRCLHPDKSYQNENDNSIVLYVQIGNLKYLFMGDASKDVEMKFRNFAVDVIKIAHHGSKTSTSDAFISSLQPKYAIIQSGRVEIFGFPDQEVIDILEKNNVVIYRTDQHYSIKIKYFAKKSIFATLR